MTKKILMGVSVLAMLTAFPALAETKANSEATTGAKVEAKLDQAGESIERTADKAVAKTKETYADVKAYFNDDKDDEVSLNINSRITAEELLGKTVEDASGKNLGEIKDILISNDGDAETVIISDSALGLGGKHAAFDYDVIEGFNKNDNARVRLTEKQIAAAKKFDTDAPLPKGELSVAKILDSKVYDASGKAVADVDTVAFEDDDADYIVVTFNQILGMGGDKAALNIDALDVTPKDGEYAFTLTQKQSAQFEAEKETKKAN